MRSPAQNWPEHARQAAIVGKPKSRLDRREDQIPTPQMRVGERVEQVVVTRNEAQHHDWIPETTIRYRGKIAERFPRPFFGHEFEWERAATEDGEVQRMFPSLIKIYPERSLRAVDEVDKICEYVEREAWGIGRRRRSRQVQQS